MALGQIEQDYGALVKELEAKSKATRQLAQQRYDELATVIREEVENRNETLQRKAGAGRPVSGLAWIFAQAE